MRTFVTGMFSVAASLARAYGLAAPATIGRHRKRREPNKGGVIKEIGSLELLSTLMWAGALMSGVLAAAFWKFKRNS